MNESFWFVVVCATAEPANLTMLSATLRGFLPYELEPLGLSSSGQLRVAS
tara:strand:+ start:893 stop:1042 length:150 start_codon:yes stop_codon:yes gene_type:complete